MAVYNVTVGKTYSPSNQMGEITMMMFERAVSSVYSTDRDKTKLGTFYWTKQEVLER